MRHPLVAFRPSRSTCIPSPRFLHSFLQVRKDHGKLTYWLQLSKWKAQIPSQSKGAMIEDDFRRRACECSQTYGLARDCRFVGWKCWLSSSETRRPCAFAGWALSFSVLNALNIFWGADVATSMEPGASITILASPCLKSRLDICYRTMPYAHEDQRLWPDLRLGASDATVRKVAEVVKWFEGVAGLLSA